MGKAKIVGGGSDGYYDAVIQYDTERLQAEIEAIDQKIIDLDTKIPGLKVERNEAQAAVDSAKNDLDLLIFQMNQGNATLEDVQEAHAKILPLIQPLVTARRMVNEAEAERLSFLKRRQFLENQKPAAQTIALWCADLTETLSPDDLVPTVEVNGEAQSVIIAPQFSNRAWAGASDGALQPVFSSGPSAVYYNWALLPAWQKWLPTYRVGTITAINIDKCSVALDSASSSQQSIDINQSQTLTNIPVEYMDCDVGAFDVGDRVIVQFESQDWTKPRVIGFESNPKPCALNDFATIPRSDAAPNGWGLPGTDESGQPINGGIGTVSGPQPWITIRTSGYAITRFIASVLAGNLYWKSSKFDIPVLSWYGPENGYAVQASAFTTYAGLAPAQSAFGQEVYSGGVAVATAPANWYVAGASVAGQAGSYRMYLACRNFAGDAIQAFYADIPDLEFSSKVTSWTPIPAPSNNPRTSDGSHASDGKMAFSGNGTTCAWVQSGVAYEWSLPSNSITMRDDLNDVRPNNRPPKPAVNIDYDETEAETNPCGEDERWVKQVTITESLNQNWSERYDHSRTAIAVDYVGDTLVPAFKDAETTQTEVFNYTSQRTHTREVICGESFPLIYDDVTMGGQIDATAGQYFVIGDSALTAADEFHKGVAFMGHLRKRDSYELPDQVEGLMRNRVNAYNPADTINIARESYVRYIDIPSGAIIYTVGESFFAGLDTEGAELYTQRRLDILKTSTDEVVFRTDEIGTFVKSDILDENNAVIVPDPRTTDLEFSIASDRYGKKVFVSVSQTDGTTLLNYLSGTDPVVLTEIYGSNPKFDPIHLL